jgi:hypothetical protein
MIAAWRTVKIEADALRYAIRVSLQGLGEPLAHPHFEEIVEEVRKYQNPVAQLEIITNGWLLSGHRWELLKSLRLGDIQVSVNAANDRTHQIAMGSRPGTFDQVVKNTDQLLADRAWEGNLKVSMVITRHSLAEVPQLLDLFVPKGVEIFQFNPLLPLTTPDWGFGRTDQYLELWCGHLPDAPELVAAAAAAIEKYRREKIVITATPEQWLLPVTPPMQSDLIQISTTRQKAAAQTGTAVERPEWERLFVQMDDDRVVLESHDRHTRVGVDQDGGVRFGGTDQSCRWAYLLRTPHLQLAAGEHALDLHVDVESGQLYGGILDIEKDDFIVQQELGPGTTRISFTLAEPRVIDVVVRQGPDDGHVSAVYRSGRLSAGTGSLSQLAGEPVAADANEDPPSPPVVLSSETPALEAPAAMSAQPTAAPAAAPPVESEGAGGHTVSKASRVYCPMVYTTLSVFHHSLDVSICCYMENAPGNRQPSLKQMPLLQAYNDDGFRLVRRTLNTDRHIPVCESCPYGASRT